LPTPPHPTIMIFPIFIFSFLLFLYKWNKSCLILPAAYLSSASSSAVYSGDQHLTNDLARHSCRCSRGIAGRAQLIHITADQIDFLADLRYCPHQRQEIHASRLRCSRSGKYRRVQDVQIHGKVYRRSADLPDRIGKPLQNERVKIRMSALRPVELILLTGSNPKLMDPPISQDLPAPSDHAGM